MWCFKQMGSFVLFIGKRALEFVFWIQIVAVSLKKKKKVHLFNYQYQVIVLKTGTKSVFSVSPNFLWVFSVEVLEEKSWF